MDRFHESEANLAIASIKDSRPFTDRPHPLIILYK